MLHEQMDPTNIETYLCSYHNGFWTAPAGSIDRTREVRCPDCQSATRMQLARDDAEYRLSWMTA